MKFLEKDLEEIIYLSGIDELRERGLEINGKLMRQVRIGNYGIADLITLERPAYGGLGKITIYELKKDKISISAFLQAVGYARGVQRLLEIRNQLDNFQIAIRLIGNDIDTSGNFCLLSDLISGDLFSLEFYQYKYEVDGIYFECMYNYYLTNEGL